MEQIYENLRTYEDYCEALAGIISGSGTGERTAPGLLKKPPVSERLLQSIWMEGHLKKDALLTLSGKSVEILSPGRWNREAGPDFLAGEIRISGENRKGDIEIHVNASDWIRHQHDRNFEYNKCILHVCLYQDDKEKNDVLFNGDKVERLLLEPYVYPDLKTLRDTFTDDDYSYHEDAGVGKCSSVFRSLDAEFLNGFFDLAGDRRIEEKMERLKNQMTGETYDQVLYQALMSSMGYKGSKTLFFLLSKRAPLAEIREYSGGKDLEERIIITQSILLHVANLIPVEKEKTSPMDEETIRYLNALNRWWMEFSGYFSDRILPQTKKWYAQVRPVNFPTRRIAGIARLLVKIAPNGGLLDNFVSLFRQGAERAQDNRSIRNFLKQTENLLTISQDPFWSFRFNFTSPRSKKSLTLIGADRAKTVLFNALLPMLLLHARAEGDKVLEDFILRCLKIFPPLPDNVVTKFMRSRLFGDEKAAKQYIFNERRQQALFKIFHDCCNNNEVTCDECYFYRQSRNRVCDESEAKIVNR